MNIGDLISRLEAKRKELGDVEVMVLDSFNGGGHPRTLNLGPSVRTLTEANAEDNGDCEDRVGEKVLVVGFGSY